MTRLPITAKVTIVLVAVGLLAGVRVYVTSRTTAAGGNPAGLTSGSALAHADHRPRHGGVVLMNGDTHFEVVLQPSGEYRVYFTDAFRNDIPPAQATEVSVAFIRASGVTERLTMHVESDCGCWTGRGQPADDPFGIVRITYTLGAPPYMIDVPVSAWTAGRASAS